MIRLGGDAYSARISFKTPEDSYADVHSVWCFGRFGGLGYVDAVSSGRTDV